MLIYCQWRTTQFCHQSADVQYSFFTAIVGAGRNSCKRGQSPFLPLSLHFSPASPSPSCSLSPLCPVSSAVKRIALIQLWVCGSNVRIFWAMNVSCGNDFGTFCAKQNVVTESTLYIFQGRASAPLANACGRPWLQYKSKRTESLITRHQFLANRLSI